MTRSWGGTSGSAPGSNSKRKPRFFVALRATWSGAQGELSVTADREGSRSNRASPGPHAEADAEGAPEQVAIGRIGGQPGFGKEHRPGIEQIGDVEEHFAVARFPDRDLRGQVEIDVERPLDAIVVIGGELRGRERAIGLALDHAIPHL